MGLYLNTADPLLSNLDVRLGIQHALALDKMIATLLRGLPASQHPMARAREISPIPTSRRALRSALAREFFAKAGFTKTGPDGILRNDKGQPLSPQHHLHHGGTCPAPHPAAGRGEKAGLNLELNLMDASAGFKSMLEKTPECLDGLERRSLSRLLGTLPQGHANKPQTNNIMNIDDDRISALVEQYDKAFDFGRRPTSPARSSSDSMARQLRPRLSGKYPGRAWRWVQPRAQGASSPRATCCIGNPIGWRQVLWIGAADFAKALRKSPGLHPSATLAGNFHRVIT